jgi:hypothetical protein
VIPLLGLILALDLAQDTDLRLYFDNLPLLATGALAALLVLLAFAYPVLFRYGMGLRPLVAGAPRGAWRSSRRTWTSAAATSCTGRRAGPC